MKNFGGVFPFYREDKTGAKFAVLWGVTLVVFVLFGMLLFSIPAHSAPRKRVKQTQPDPARTLQIQQALVDNGKLPATTGKWDKPTIDALRQIAADHSWQTCIVPDARVINILGLGSDTAGIAAPPPSDAPNPLDHDLMKFAQDHPEVCTK